MKKIINITFLVFAVFCSEFVFGQTWKPIGPFNRSAGNSQGAGMISTLAFHPLYNTADASIGGAINKTIFAGSPYGGIWITRDDGANWSNVDPLGQYTNLNVDFLPGCGVMDIVIDPNNPTIIYASISSSEFASGYPLVGMNINYHPSIGIYRYAPGTGWVAKMTYAYASNHSVATLTLDPASTTTIYASTSDGILKSTNSGTTWTNILTAGLEKPFRNVVFDPTNATNIFASGQDVFKSTNGGSTWTNVSNFSSIITNNTQTISVNIDVISATSVYARVFYTSSALGKNTEDFFHYDGSSWTDLAMFPHMATSWGTYHYDRMPILARKIGSVEYVFAGSELLNCFTATVGLWTSGSWAAISNYNGNMHADIHDIAFSPGNATLWVGHDGGVSSTYANFYTSPTWTTINNGLNIATIYSFAGAQKSPQLFLTGESDNGNAYVNNADENNFNSIAWTGYQAADGGDKMISWDNPNDWYDRKEMYSGDLKIYRNTSGIPGYTTNVFTNSSIDPVPPPPPPPVWDAHYLMEEFGDIKPLVMDPNNPNLVYRGGTSNLIRSLDNGVTSQILFRKSDCFDISNIDYNGHITAIAIAPTNSNYLYINYNNVYPWDAPFSNHIYKTTNALTSTYKAACPHSPTDGVVCGNWTDITPPFTTTNTAILKRSSINSVVVSDKDPNLIWACFSYNPGMAGFLVWKYDGTTWSDYGAGLPANTSITALVYEKGSNDGIYAGTDVGGVYYRNKSMSSWIPYGTGLPHALIVKMEINNTENTLRVGTKGRGIWKTNLYCPTAPLLITGCTNCNSPTNYFWEGTSVTISNTTLNTNKHFVRAVDYIEILPTTVLDPAGNSNVYYELFIHGCDPSTGNTYRSLINEDPEKAFATEEEIDKLHSNPILIYPNPNAGIFTLSLENENVKDIYVYDILGKVVYEQRETTLRKLEINISDKPKGLYITKIVEGDKIQTLKFISQ